MSAPSVVLWAAVIKSQRSEWIHHYTIRSTRRAAKAAYLETWIPSHHRIALKNVRFAKVVVALQETPND